MGLRFDQLPTSITVTSADIVPMMQAGVTRQNTIGNIVGTSSGSSLIGFLQSGTGAVARTVQAKERDIISVLDFGAIGDGVTDDTAAIQSAITAAPSGAAVVFPGASYKYAGGLTVSKALTFVGGGYGTALNINDPTANGFVITLADVGVNFANLRLDSSVTRTGGSYVVVNGSGTSNKHSSWTNCIFANGWMDINFGSASYWRITSCAFLAHVNTGLSISNTINGDEGDSIIQGCVFSVTGTASDHIKYISSSGLKITGTKFLNGNRGFVQSNPTATNLGTLVMAGNSFENQNTHGIIINPAGTGTFQRVAIVGNEFLETGAAWSTAIDMEAGLSYVDITGNVFDLRRSAAGASKGIAVNANSATQILIGHNTFKGTITGGTINAIDTSGSTGVIHVSDNQIDAGFTNRIIPGAGTIIRDMNGFTAAQLALISPSDGSYMYATDAKNPGDGAFAHGAIQSGGTGAQVFRANGIWWQP